MKMVKGEAGQDVDVDYWYYDNIGNDGNGNVNDDVNDDDEKP